MAENLVNAGIGIDFKYTGMEQFNKLTQQINEVKHDMSDVYQGMQNINTFTDTFSRNSQSAFNKVRQSVESVSRATNNISSNSVNKLSESTSKTTRSTNDLTDKIRALTGSVKDVSGNSIQQLQEKMKSLGNTTRDSEGKFNRLRDTALGVFSGNALLSGWQGLSSGIKDAVQQGLQFNAAAEDMKKRWSQAGLSASSSNAMVKQISDIRQHADISAAAINNMQKQYLVLTGSASQARALTNTITSFGTASGMNEEQQGRIARLVSSNKNVNARMFNRTLGQSPAFANEIIKQTGMSKQAFYSLLQSGKLTGQQLRDAMIKASKDSNIAWSDYAKTATGKMDLVKATVSQSKKVFETSLTGSMFDQINKAAGNNKNLNNLQKNVEKTAKDVGKALGSILGGVVGFIAKNIKPIEGVAQAVWSITSAIASGAWKTFTGIFGMFTSKAGKASNGMKTIDKALTGLSKHQSMLQNIGKLIVAAFAAKKIYQFGSAIGNGINVVRGFTKSIKEAKNAQGLLNAVMDANPFGLIALAIAGLGVGVVELYKHFKPFRKLVNGTFKAVKKAVSSWWKQVQKNFKSVQKIINSFAKFFKKYFGNVIKDGVKTAKQSFKVIGDVIRVFKDVFTLNFKDLGKAIPKLIGDLWKLVKDIFKEGADFVEDIGSNMWKSIWNTFKGWGKAIGNFFKDLWDGIGDSIKSGINDVIGIINAGIKGVNWVLSKVGGSGHTIGTIKPLATGTMGGRLNQHTMAMLNDGNDSPETGNKEMAILPNGRAFIPQKRNWVGMLPKGTAVLNATETKMFMMMNGIRKFADGTGFFGGLINGAKKVANAIAHPIKFIKSLFHGIGKTSEFITDFTGGLANKAKDAIVDFFKNNSGADNPGGSGVARWRSVAEKAAAFMGIKLSGNDISSLLARIAKESGGNPTIVQKVDDVNSRAGHPAQGLFQYVPSTFASWAVKGHNNLQNGFDQFLAVFNDSNWRSDINMPGGWGPTGHRARKNGGPVKKDEWYKVNEAGFEMFKPKTDGTIINHSDSKKAIASANKPITVDARLTVNVNGSVDDNSIDKIYEAQNNQLRQIGELLKSNSGINDGGMISL